MNVMLQGPKSLYMITLPTSTLLYAYRQITKLWLIGYEFTLLRNSPLLKNQKVLVRNVDHKAYQDGGVCSDVMFILSFNNICHLVFNIHVRS